MTKVPKLYKEISGMSGLKLMYAYKKSIIDQMQHNVCVAMGMSSDYSGDDRIRDMLIETEVADRLGAEVLAAGTFRET